MGAGLSERAESLKGRGIRLYGEGQYEASAACFEEARALFAAVGDIRGQGETLNNLGVISLQAECWEEARERFEEAGRLFESLADIGGRAQTLGNLGELARRLGRREEAVEYLKEAADLLREVDEGEEERAKTLELISRVRLEEGRWLEALYFYDLRLGCFSHPGLKERLLHWLVKIPLSLLTRGGAG